MSDRVVGVSGGAGSRLLSVRGVREGKRVKGGMVADARRGPV